ncbi:hypothetical protein COR50_03495 [Chitinophaga caeni]|uniref:Uncharacterized protein n=1 Tax=Chitinophaga caeni TaxID=2029983 RepID=A0A291QR05_9BACT|nr:hypothetical protein COR50_03495 [Chitinophaga caeni]
MLILEKGNSTSGREIIIPGSGSKKINVADRCQRFGNLIFQNPFQVVILLLAPSINLNRTIT